MECNEQSRRENAWTRHQPDNSRGNRLEAKTETIVELAEQFHQEQDLLGMTACTMALAKVITLAAGFPENIEEEGGNVHFSLRRNGLSPTPRPGSKHSTKGHTNSPTTAGDNPSPN